MISIADLKQRAVQILDDLDEPVVIMQRGRATAVLLSAKRYAQIKEDLKLLDDLELLRMIDESKQAVQNNQIISHNEVKNRLKFRK